MRGCCSVSISGISLSFVIVWVSVLINSSQWNKVLKPLYSFTSVNVLCAC